MNATAHGGTHWPRLLGHALLLTLGTLAVFAVLLAATLLPGFGEVAVGIVLSVWLTMPYWLIPLHLRWQSPRESSVALAFITGLFCWFATFVMLVWVSPRIGG